MVASFVFCIARNRSSDASLGPSLPTLLASRVAYGDNVRCAIHLHNKRSPSIWLGRPNQHQRQTGTGRALDSLMGCQTWCLRWLKTRSLGQSLFLNHTNFSTSMMVDAIEPSGNLIKFDAIAIMIRERTHPGTGIAGRLVLMASVIQPASSRNLR